MLYDFKMGHELPITSSEEIPELVGYYPLYLYHQRTSKVPNWAYSSQPHSLGRPNRSLFAGPFLLLSSQSKGHSLNSWIRHPFLTKNNASWQEITKRFAFSMAPLLSQSGSFSFDAISNEVSVATTQPLLETSLLTRYVQFFDSAHKEAFKAFLEVSVRLHPSIDRSANPPSVGGTLRFDVSLSGGTEAATDHLVLSLKPRALCTSDAEFPVELSDKSLPDRLRDLNFFQVVNKVSLAYKVVTRWVTRRSPSISGPVGSGLRWRFHLSFRGP